MFSNDLRSYLLQPSASLREFGFLEYPLRVRRPFLSGVLLAPIFELQITAGTMAAELCSSSGSVIRKSVRELSSIDPSTPLSFRFDVQVDSSDEDYELRGSIAGADIPVRIY